MMATDLPPHDQPEVRRILDAAASPLSDQLNDDPPIATHPLARRCRRERPTARRPAPLGSLGARRQVKANSSIAMRSDPRPGPTSAY